MNELFWISFWSVVAGICLLAIGLGVYAWEKRCSKQAMLALRAMNRGVMDSPDWVKQQWQHDAGECTALAVAEKEQIERFSARSMKSAALNSAC